MTPIDLELVFLTNYYEKKSLLQKRREKAKGICCVGEQKNMKQYIKKVLPSLGLKGVMPLARRMRSAWWWLFDIVGYVIVTPILLFYNMFKNEEVQKVLIIRLDRIGDVVLSTPAIRAVRQSFSLAKIHVIVQEYTSELIITNNDIDRIIVHGKDRLERNYDVAIALHPGLYQNYLTFRSGATKRVGYTGWGGGFFLTHRIHDDRAVRLRHEVESALEVVALVGCKTTKTNLELSVTQEGEAFAASFLATKKILHPWVVIHPGARQPYIRWKKEGFAELADLLIRDAQVQVALTGSEAEEDLLLEIVEKMEMKPVCVTGVSITQLIAIINSCDLFIGNSTGPMHIAAALGVPVIAIFGSQHPLDSYHEWGPWSDKSIVISKDTDCLECHPTDCINFDCMNNIETVEIFEAAQNLLGKYMLDK